jgi:hypothetical protein
VDVLPLLMLLYWILMASNVQTGAADAHREVLCTPFVRSGTHDLLWVKLGWLCCCFAGWPGGREPPLAAHGFSH